MHARPHCLFHRPVGRGRRVAGYGRGRFVADARSDAKIFLRRMRDVVVVVGEIDYSRSAGAEDDALLRLGFCYYVGRVIRLCRFAANGNVAGR